MTIKPRTFYAADNLDALRKQPGANLNVLLRERYSFLRRFIDTDGCVLELGAGIGVTREFIPPCKFIQSDIEYNPWLNAVMDGEKLPFADSVFDAVICILALHHMPHPGAALKECARVLKPGGNMIILESSNSWVLQQLIRITDHEYIDDSVDPFAVKNSQKMIDNWDGNNAIGDLLFSDEARLREFVPELTIVHRRRTEFFLFINSGGVNKKMPYFPLPEVVLKYVLALDKWCCRVAPGIFSLSQEVVLRRND